MNPNSDTALKLRIDSDNGIRLSAEQALSELNKSYLIEKLTSDLHEKPLFYVWRIIALSEIPYTIHLNYTQNLIDRIYNKLSTPFGFSLDGNERSFQTTNTRLLSLLLSKLENENYIHAEWQNISEKYICFMSKNGKNLVAKDLSTAYSSSVTVKGEKEQTISDCISSIKSIK